MTAGSVAVVTKRQPRFIFHISPSRNDPVHIAGGGGHQKPKLQRKMGRDINLRIPDANCLEAWQRQKPLFRSAGPPTCPSLPGPGIV